MLVLSQKNYARILGITSGTACVRLRGVAPLPEKGYWGAALYHCADLLPTLKRDKDRRKAADIVTGAEVIGDPYYLPERAVERGMKMYRWLDDRQRDRVEVVRAYFCEGLGRSMQSSAMLEHLPALGWKLITHHAMTRFIVANDRRELPDNWADWASIFSVVNAAYDYDLTKIDKVA